MVYTGEHATLETSMSDEEFASREVAIPAKVVRSAQPEGGLPALRPTVGDTSALSARALGHIAVCTSLIVIEGLSIS